MWNLKMFGFNQNKKIITIYKIKLYYLLKWININKKTKKVGGILYK